MKRLHLALVVFVLAATPFLTRFPMFTGLREQIPLGNFASIQKGGEAGPGQPTLESNMGYTAQALGRQAAKMWFSGKVPLWNHFEGTGVPLAGEMQGAALFLPFILLMKGLDGQIYFHLCLQIVAGLSTFFFLRRLNLGTAAALFGALVFEHNGTFSWMANAAYNPVAFLPMALLGVELVIDASGRRASAGWAVLCLAATWSVYAGFPEVAYVDALFVVLYAFSRLAGKSRVVVWGSLSRFALAAIVTILLVLPLIAEFTSYMAQGYSDGRGHSGGASMPVDLGLAPMLAPYIFGPIGGLDTEFWGRSAGYLGFSIPVLALAGAWWCRRQTAVLFSAVWALLALLKVFGTPHFNDFVLNIPFFSYIVLQRWLVPSIEFSFALLAAFAVNELLRVRSRSLIVPVLIVLGALAWGRQAVHHLGLFEGHGTVITSYPNANFIFIGVFAAVAAVACFFGRWGSWTVYALALVEMTALFVVPLFSAPRFCRYDYAGLAFVRDRAGLDRVYTLGPMLPNYGSAFSIAELNYDDMPISSRLVDYFKANLDPWRDATNTKPDWNRNGGPRNIEVLKSNYRAFGQAGIRLALVSPWESLPAPFKQVYESEVMRVYELPEVRSYFTAGGSVVAYARDEAHVTCAQPTTLVRLETYMPNWRATVDGHPATVRCVEGLFQAVDLPAGSHTVTFSYAAAHGAVTIPGFLIALFALALAGWYELRDRWNTSRIRDGSRGPSEGEGTRPGPPLHESGSQPALG